MLVHLFCSSSEDQMKMMMNNNVVDGLMPTLLMVVVSAAFSSANVLNEVAELDGMSSQILSAYRFIFSSAFMIPLALFYERKNKPKLTWRVFYMTFLCGLFGGTFFQNLYLESMSLTSATFISAVFNLIPAITFVLAISFRLEKLNLGTAAGKAKVVGTIIGIAGAMVLTFYNGVEVKLWPSHHKVWHSSHHDDDDVHKKSGIGPQIAGIACALGSCFSYALWLIIQGLMSKNPKEYPSHYSNTALMSSMASIQCVAFAVTVERDWSQWKLGWDVRLLAVAFSGIVSSGFMIIAIGWCVEKRGPLFVSAFSPLMLVIVVIGASLTLGEKLYLGSVVGSVLIVWGLYMVLWGNKRETKMATTLSTQTSLQISDQLVFDEKVLVTPPPAPRTALDDDDDTDNNKSDHINISLHSFVSSKDDEEHKKGQQEDI